jgi:hypothetical protein
MGPIERELRAGVHLAQWSSTDAAISACAQAAQRLKYRSMLDAYNNNAWPDVLSDTIECAEHFGL